MHCPHMIRWVLLVEQASRAQWAAAYAPTAGQLMASKPQPQHARRLLGESSGFVHAQPCIKRAASLRLCGFGSAPHCPKAASRFRFFSAAADALLLLLPLPLISALS